MMPSDAVAFKVILHAERLVKRYGDVTAVNELSLDPGRRNPGTSRA
jgi:hypothetical protein